MKIIQIIPSLNLAGAERMCETLSGELQKMGHDVVVVSLYNTHTSISDNLEQKGIRVIRLDKKSGLDVSMIPKIRRILKVEDPDIVHAHLSILKYVGTAALFKKTRIVHTIHSMARKESGLIDRMINWFFYKIKKAIPVALNKEVQESVSELYHMPVGQVAVVFNGSDLTKCFPKDTYALGENLNILHVGRFAPVKNHKGLLVAFESFLNTHPNSLLHLVGDGEKRAEIGEYVAEHELKDHVIFHGLQSNVHGFLHEADIFILPSIYEGFPITLIEAMGTGLPIVATKAGGIPDVVSDGETGTLTSFETEEIVAALEAYADNEDLRRVHGQNAKVAAYEFSSQKMAEGYENIYKSLLRLESTR